jgi:hypothetical protein
MGTQQQKVTGAVLALLGVSVYACSDVAAPQGRESRISETVLANNAQGPHNVLDISSSPYGCGVSRRAIPGAMMKYSYTAMRFHGKEVQAMPGTPTVKLRIMFEDGTADPAGMAVCTVPNSPDAIAYALKHLVKANAKAKRAASSLGAKVANAVSLPNPGHALGDLAPVVTTAPWTYYDYADMTDIVYHFDLDSSIADSGGGYSPYYDPETNVQDCSVDSTTVPYAPLNEIMGADESVTDFDCRKVQCPSAMVILNNASVVAASEDMLAQMQEDPSHLERGAWIVMDNSRRIGVGTVDDNGLVHLGRVYVGQPASECYFLLGCVKQLTSEPTNLQAGWYIIGILHSHKEDTSQSDNDLKNAVNNGDYSIVTTAKSLYLLGPTGFPRYQCDRQKWERCLAP